MTQEEFDKAVNKLIEEANEESESAKKRYEADCRAERDRALSRRIFRSTVLDAVLATLKEEYDALVLKIQKELDESLEALYGEGIEGGGGGGDIDPDDVPYEVDYTLPMRDRYVAVKNYYLDEFDDMAASLAAFEADEIAKDYLGSYYDYLHQLLLLLQ